MTWKRLARNLWRLVFCTICCQDLFSSVFALGWTYRWVRHSVARELFDRSPIARKTRWHDFATAQQEIEFLRDAPHLILRQKGVTAPGPSVLKVLHFLLHSFWLNFKTGVCAILPTWTCTLLPCILWAMAWYTGWHISFHKMYEESATGVSVGFLGLVIFTAVMLYVPVAQTRHAFTGDWQSFFDFRFVKTLLCHRPIQLFLLAICYAIAGFVLLFFKILPAFLPAINPALEDLSPQESLAFLNDYFFYTGAIAFSLFFLLRSAGGKIYGGAIVEMWQKQILSERDFHPEEIRMLELFRIAEDSARQKPNPLQKILLFPLGFGHRVAMTVATCILWAGFSFMPFISEFANYYPQRGFLNQPLVQLPCFRYVPARLEEEVKAIEFTSQ